MPRFLQDDDDEIRSPFMDSLSERLLRARTVIISGEITQRLAARTSAQLLALSAEDEAPITMFVNSQGGHVEAGDTIHDLVRYIRAPVRMVGTGWVASAGALIYVSVPREQRYCLPNTRFLLHQPAGGAGGSAADIDIEAREILKMRDRLNQIFSTATGQTIERIEEDTHRNFWLDAKAAVDYGLVGQIIEQETELDGARGRGGKSTGR
ncbi:MAG TPA: ATP-dependent Clp protease proteolytic subunit [Gemmatimonadales bacterium]|jgi:ATP-dependent Clp protease protease subunit|nr:ATP-dependent Clp protease proteolytic subunit [Gemmatimonadales bacterium]